MAITPDRLAQIDSFEAMAFFFYEELHWPRNEWNVFRTVSKLYELTPEDIPGVISLEAVQRLDETQEWGIFLVDFGGNELKRPELRKILNKVAEKGRSEHSNPTWPLENILFICHSRGNEWTFVFFKGDKLSNSRLRHFGWTDPYATRTVRDRNLPKLTWSNQADWASAFSAEQLARDFFIEYRDVFEVVEKSVVGLEKEAARRFTQALFNRLMFLCYLQEKQWLEFPSGDKSSRKRYLFNLWDSNRTGFYDVLKLLFFSGLGSENGLGGERSQLEPTIGRVPFLNGGLFEPDHELDKIGVTVPDGVFERILGKEGLFQRYTFTVTESTPDRIEVALDPEMLGKIFEELVVGRHQTGSYYTPRNIVSFMCREALKGYLGGYAQLVDEHDPVGIEISEATALIQKLENVKVLDPACGSGAYLVGMLQEIHALQFLLDTAAHQDKARDDYDRKLRIIENCIYGVDKDKFAVTIAWLRLWLALVIDDTRNPLDQPGDDVSLPNLDVKIEAKDSLMSPAPERLMKDIEGFHRELILQFQDQKGRYMKAHTALEKAELRTRMDESRHDINTWLRGDRDEVEEKLTNAKLAKARASNPTEEHLAIAQIASAERELSHVKEQPPQDAMDWAVEFAEVFFASATDTHELGGFDIVVANPPYVNSGELLRSVGREYKDSLVNAFPRTATGTADLLVFFFDRAVELLRDGGQLAFITSNKWLKAAYGQKLRGYLAAKTQVRHLIDFNDLPVFQNVIAYPLITIATKGGFGSETRYTSVTSLNPPYPDLGGIIEEWGGDLAKDALGNDGTWRLESGQAADRLAKMRARAIPLGEYVKGQIYYGIKTGLNEVKFGSDGKMYGKSVPDGVRVVRKEGVFVIDGAKRAELIAEDHKSEEIIKPLIGGRDIWRWRTSDPSRWLIVTKIGTDMNRYPAVMKHLQRFEALLRPRVDQGEHWWELRACAYWDQFERPKLVCQDLSAETRWALSPPGCYVSNTGYIFGAAESESSADLYLLGVLNSSQVLEFYRGVSPEMQGGFLRFIYQYLEQIPIPSAADSDRQAVVALVEQILRKKAESVEVDVSDLEAEINRRVEFLYFGEGDSYEDALANDAAEIRALLRPKLETAKLEFKETLYYDIRLGTIHGDRVIDVAKAICAMLNREGGTILIGVNDDAEIVGIERDLASFGKEGKLGTPDQFQRKLAEPFGVKLRPDPTDLIRVRFIPIDGKLVCRVDVTSDKATMFTLNEKVYVRRDGSSVEMSPADTAHWWQRRHREGE